MPTRPDWPRSHALRGLVLALVCISSLLAVSRAHALQRLANPGFESGTTGWLGEVVATGCPARSGIAAGLVSSEGAGWTEQRAIVNGGSGPHSATGYARLLSGSGRVQVTMRWLSATNTLIGQQSSEVDLTTAYAYFSSAPATTPAQAATLALRFRVVATTPPAVICLDDLVLDGPGLVSPTAVPSATSSPTPGSTVTLTPAASPSATSSPAATSTSSPVPTAGGPPAPGARLLNPGFESGTDGWQKYGGELRSVSTPTKGGTGAGLFTSATASTKWVYQTVVIEPGGTYEFSGYLRPGEGVREGYLRVAWYASSDGSGSALATSDSTTTLAGPASAYGYLTTGVVRAPANAHSARVRAMLVPSGAADLYMDDFSFLPATGAAASEAPTAAAVADDELQDDPVADSEPATEGASAQTAGAAAPGEPRSTARTARADATAAGNYTPSEVSETGEASGGGPGIVLWSLLTLGFFAVGLGAARVHARRSRR